MVFDILLSKLFKQKIKWIGMVLDRTIYTINFYIVMILSMLVGNESESKHWRDTRWI